MDEDNAVRNFDATPDAEHVVAYLPRCVLVVLEQPVAEGDFHPDEIEY